MYYALTALLDRLDDPSHSHVQVMPGTCPIVAFGDIEKSKIATLGINPSNREFVDSDGKELQGDFRRFHTLNSLGLSSWADADARILELVISTFVTYFARNPYDTWFGKLDYIMGSAEFSYYGDGYKACHLDLVPFATETKWGNLSSQERAELLGLSASSLGILLRDSQVGLLILNGSTVVHNFQRVAEAPLQAEENSDWDLFRQNASPVKGVAYMGAVRSVAGISLDRELQVIGFNHNLQSSFGVSNRVMSAIRKWVGTVLQEVQW